MRPRARCSVCGNEVRPERSAYCYKQKLPVMCDDCFHAVRGKARAEKQQVREALLRAKFEGRRCVVCGGLIPWKDSYYKKNPETNWPITCSPTCHGIQSKRDSTQSREEVEQRITDFIKSKGRYVSYAEVEHEGHICSKAFRRFGISIAEMNKRVLGLQEVRVHAYTQVTRQAKCISEICATLNIPMQTHAQVARWLMDTVRQHTFEFTRAMLEELVCSFIATQLHYVGTVAVMRALGISHDSMRSHYKIDVPQLNHDLGFCNKRQSWYEDEAYFILRRLVGAENVSREHVFPECRSDKGYPLRFDFYLPMYRLLVEVDGKQHVDETNPYYKKHQCVNDSIKAQYAQDNQLTLIRVATEPRLDFTSRFEQSVLDVLKPIELRETPPSNVEGNPQPRLCKRKQVGFDFVQ